MYSRAGNYVLLGLILLHAWVGRAALERRDPVRDPSEYPIYLEAATAFINCAKLLWNQNQPQIRALEPSYQVTGGLNMWHLFPDKDARSTEDVDVGVVNHTMKASTDAQLKRTLNQVRDAMVQQCPTQFQYKYDNQHIAYRPDPADPDNNVIVESKGFVDPFQSYIGGNGIPLRDLPDHMSKDEVWNEPRLWREPGAYFAASLMRINTRAMKTTKQRKQDNFIRDMTLLPQHPNFRLTKCQEGLIPWALGKLDKMWNDPDKYSEYFLEEIEDLLVQELDKIEQAEGIDLSPSGVDHRPHTTHRIQIPSSQAV